MSLGFRSVLITTSTPLVPHVVFKLLAHQHDVRTVADWRHCCFGLLSHMFSCSLLASTGCCLHCNPQNHWLEDSENDLQPDSCCPHVLFTDAHRAYGGRILVSVMIFSAAVMLSHAWTVILHFRDHFMCLVPLDHPEHQWGLTTACSMRAPLLPQNRFSLMVGPAICAQSPSRAATLAL